MALLETRDLSKSFGGLQAIDKVSLKVEPNTIVTVEKPTLRFREAS